VRLSGDTRPAGATILHTPYPSAPHLPYRYNVGICINGSGKGCRGKKQSYVSVDAYV